VDDSRHRCGGSGGHSGSAGWLLRTASSTLRENRKVRDQNSNRFTEVLHARDGSSQWKDLGALVTRIGARGAEMRLVRKSVKHAS
jgi:hypothetical protein